MYVNIYCYHCYNYCLWHFILLLLACYKQFCCCFRYCIPKVAAVIRNLFYPDLN